MALLTEKELLRFEWVVAQWAHITIREFQFEMVRKGISINRLYKSFTYNLKMGSNGMPSEISIGFLYHGRFVDMGVGKGVKMEDIKGNIEVYRNLSGKQKKTASKPRRPKRFYSPVAYREFAILSRILAQEFNMGISNVLETELSLSVTIQQ
jgi:hypothetical protein